MQRLPTPEEKKKLRTYLRQDTLFSRLALYILGPIWLAVILRCAFELYYSPSFEAWASANDSFWAINRSEICIGLTVLIVIAFGHNRYERFEIGRVRETTGVLSRATDENGKGYRLNGEPLWIPYTMDLDCARFDGKEVIVERADVLRTRRAEGQTMDRLVVSIRLNDFTSAR
jgi:hypothetical protein